MGKFLFAGLLAAMFIAAGCGTESSRVVTTRPEPAAPEPPVARALQPFSIQFRHLPGITCEEHKESGACGVAAHWKCVAGDSGATTLEYLGTLLEFEADRQRVAGYPLLSDREVLISGEPGAPWVLVRQAMHRCDRAGIFRIQWRASVSELDAEVVDASLPEEFVPRDELHVSLSLDLGGNVQRAVNDCRVDSDESLLGLLTELASHYQALGRTDPRILVDADPEVPWSRVVDFVTRCHDIDLSPVEFELEEEAPLRANEDRPALTLVRGKWGVQTYFGGRLGGRKNLTVRGGGTTGAGGTESAVSAGLRWLARHQDPDGHWSSEEFSGQCAPAKCAGKGYAEFDTGVTGLALLAYLGAGYTHLTKETYTDPVTGAKVCWGEVFRKGIRWLLSRQDAEGCFGGRRGSKYMYNHAIAAAAMAEAYGLTGSMLFKESAQRGIDFIMVAQNPHKGWRYTKLCADNDTSVTGWCIMALHSASLSGLIVGKECLGGARKWIQEVTDEKTFEVGYSAKGCGKVVVQGKNEDWDNHPTMTAVGMICRMFVNPVPGDPSLEGGTRLLVPDLPACAENKIDYCYWHFGSLALFHSSAPDGESWKTWNEAMKAALVPSQNKKDAGCEEGSWDADVDRWGFEGGRVYATAINVLTLETYYRYERVIRGGFRK